MGNFLSKSPNFSKPLSQTSIIVRIMERERQQLNTSIKHLMDRKDLKTLKIVKRVVKKRLKQNVQNANACHTAIKNVKSYIGLPTKVCTSLKEKREKALKDSESATVSS